MTHAARNLVMDLQDSGCRARFLIQDRDGKFPDLFDAILANAGIAIVLSGIPMPRTNSTIERWAQTCRHELLDRTLIWNQTHPLHALRQFEYFYNEHPPHQGIANARPLCAPPAPPADPKPDRAPRHPKTRPPRRNPARVRACRVTRADDISARTPSDGLNHTRESGEYVQLSRLVGCPTSVGRVGLDPRPKDYESVC